MKKWISLLTICRKAGRLVMGFDPAKEEVAAHRAHCVFVTADASEKTKKEVRFFCTQADVPMMETAVTMQQMQQALGRRAGVLAICDTGFAEKLMALATAPSTDIEQGTDPVQKIF
jgi:ribosomal protein L7Ae-like RNA K-turn-binding protein